MTDEVPPPEQVALVPIRQQTVDFYGDHILAGQLADGTITVPMRPLVEALGLDWSSQRQRLNRDPALRAAQGVVVITTPGGDQRFLALPLKLLPGFLFGLNASRVKPELRDKILRYQADCYEVLWNAFKADILPAAFGPTDLSGAALALEIGEAITNMARQQLELEGRVTTIADYTRSFIQRTRAHQAQTDHRLDAAEDRLQALELRLDPTAVITEEQAAELALAVKNVGQRLAAQGERTGYAQVYSEMYRRYRVSSYKNLQRAHYDEVLAWLYGWYEDLGTPESLP